MSSNSRDYKVTVENGNGKRAESTIHCTSEAEAREPHGGGNLRIVSVEVQPGTERTN